MSTSPALLAVSSCGHKSPGLGSRSVLCQQAPYLTTKATYNVFEMFYLMLKNSPWGTEGCKKKGEGTVIKSLEMMRVFFFFCLSNNFTLM